jgi:hypothetical protein
MADKFSTAVDGPAISERTEAKTRRAASQGQESFGSLFKKELLPFLSMAAQDLPQIMW